MRCEHKYRTVYMELSRKLGKAKQGKDFRGEACNKLLDKGHGQQVPLITLFHKICSLIYFLGNFKFKICN
jgi:hypothetical protein